MMKTLKPKGKKQINMEKIKNNNNNKKERI